MRIVMPACVFTRGPKNLLVPRSRQRAPSLFFLSGQLHGNGLLTLPGTVLWAQRSSKTEPSANFVYLTIAVPDVPPEQFKLELKPTSLSFTGTSSTLKKTYHVELEFFAEIDETESKISHTARDVEIKLIKKELGEAYWPRLLKDSKKVHFLKTNFDKWVDEDEQNEAAEEDFSNFGNMGT